MPIDFKKHAQDLLKPGNFVTSWTELDRRWGEKRDTKWQVKLKKGKKWPEGKSITNFQCSVAVNVHV